MNEVTQAFVRKGQTVLLQACRIHGSASSARLTISPVALRPRQTPRCARPA